MSEKSSALPVQVDDDAAELATLGYKQELHRGMSGFSNFAVSFSIISILAGCITSFNIAMKSGGPAAITISWPLVGVFVLCVALAVVVQFFCGLASVTESSCMTYAFSRDNALPGSRIWATVNPRTGTPTNSIWLC